MMIKYRVSDVAKDFGVPAKEVIELLSRYFQPAKKSATALEEEELDVVFEYYTQKFAVDSFDAYFATAAERPKPEKKAEKAPEKKTEKPAPEKAPAAKAEKPVQKKPAPVEKPVPKKPATPPIEIKTQPKKKQPVLERGPIERRTVDTRSAQVDVGKYDEKFDVMAQKNSNMRRRSTRSRSNTASRTAVARPRRSA